MLVYRIEDDHAEGPYNGDGSDAENLYRYHMADVGNYFDVYPTHPGPMDDMPLLIERKDRNHYRFGFSSIEQLHDWFGPAARAFLKPKGYKLASYSVPDAFVLMGSKQVAFDARKAKLVERKPITKAG